MNSREIALNVVNRVLNEGTHISLFSGKKKKKGFRKPFHLILFLFKI